MIDFGHGHLIGGLFSEGARATPGPPDTEARIDKRAPIIITQTDTYLILYPL